MPYFLFEDDVLDKKILIVDDEDAIRFLLAHFISPRFPFEILQATSGNSAIELLKKEKDIEVILCDYRMGDGNGGTVYDYIKRNELLVPFVMMSTDKPEKYDCFKGFYEENPKNDYLQKPFQQEALISILEKILEG